MTFLTSLLSRSTGAGRFIPEIDGMRFLAITLVLLHHAEFIMRDVTPADIWAPYQFLRKAGGLGVPLFFVISGMVLGLPFARTRLRGGKPVSLRAYFWRRLRRLEPPFIINLTILFGLMVVIGGSIERLPNYIASLTYTHNMIYNAWSEINFVAWSLEVEAQFYILMPLFAIIFSLRHRRVWMLAVGVAGIAASLLLTEFRYTHSLLVYVQYFLVGLLLADLMVTDRLYPARPSFWFDVAALCCFGVAIWSDIYMQALGAIALAGFFLCVFRGRALLALFRLPLIYVIGGMCYTIYLYHFWIIEAAVRGFDLTERSYTAWQIVLFDVVACSAVFAVSAVLFLLFEKPFMTGRSKPAPARRVTGFRRDPSARNPLD
ncbi:MAG: acyltransferase [Pseudomonadota bacterium]|nr:acyltransferase [Pseudomonadota bacterium]